MFQYIHLPVGDLGALHRVFDPGDNKGELRGAGGADCGVD